MNSSVCDNIFEQLISAVPLGGKSGKKTAFQSTVQWWECSHRFSAPAEGFFYRYSQAPLPEEHIQSENKK